MGMTYAEAGMDIDKTDESVKFMAKWCEKTFAFREGKTGSVADKIGHFANLIEVGNKYFALATDGIGSKILVAEKLGKFDTLGYDLLAMICNDVICVNAEPLAVVDYLAVKEPDNKLMDELGKGLHDAAKECGVAIVGGETAVLPEMISTRFDLAGACMGVVEKGDEILGDKISDNDVLIGLASSGVHSNGLTLARKATENWTDLLTPTNLYVKPIMELTKEVPVKGLANITGGGVTNLHRIGNGFRVDNWAKPQKVFEDIQRNGKISDEEMFKTFNMGVGFCVVVPESSVDTALGILKKHVHSWELGRATSDNKITLTERKLVF